MLIFLLIFIYWMEVQSDFRDFECMRHILKLLGQR